ncbi:hypothetical protein D3C71_1115930 [compost metagenome]
MQNYSTNRGATHFSTPVPLIPEHEALPEPESSSQTKPELYHPPVSTIGRIEKDLLRQIWPKPFQP